MQRDWQWSIVSLLCAVGHLGLACSLAISNFLLNISKSSAFNLCCDFLSLMITRYTGIQPVYWDLLMLVKLSSF